MKWDEKLPDVTKWQTAFTQGNLSQRSFADEL